MLALTILSPSWASTSLVFFGIAVGGWLVMRPNQIVHYLSLKDEDEWSQLIIQIIGQIILGVVIVPVIITCMQLIYF